MSLSRPIARIDGYGALPSAMRGGVVAIGNLDGVHRGHQQVLEAALEKARVGGVPALALTFEPHPRTVFRPDAPVARITPARAKAHILGALGFDAVVEQPFTREFASLPASAFIDDLLVSGLGISHVMAGHDFHFGKGRTGTPDMLVAAGAGQGFGVTLVDAFTDEAGATISSSRIRSLLAEGALGEATGLLGYRPVFEAGVTGGKKLGRTLGFPTANMALPAETPLAHGIYAVRFRRANGDIHDGVASFGRRPTVDEDGAPLLETFLFGFSGDLYGEVCTVTLVSRLRGEEKFDSLDALVAQMRRDEAEAREILPLIAPLSPLDAALSFA